MKARFLLLVLVLLVTCFYPLLAPPHHRIDKAHFDQIHEGMTLADVEAIFGVSAGSYDWAVQSDSSIYFILSLAQVELETRLRVQIELQAAPSSVERLPTEPVGRYQNWISRHGSFAVLLDPCGSVVRKFDLGATRIEPPWQRWWRLMAK